MRDKLRIRGAVTARVLDARGCVKRRPPGLLRRLLGLKGRLMSYTRHNIVTREGDALIADALLAAPARARITETTGHMQVGTGWTGSGTKNNRRCNQPAGAMRRLDGAPALKAPWGAHGDNVVTYRATFAAGALIANGINEVCLLNGSGAGADCLAYAQIAPSANVSADDTLQILWEITILGQ